MAQKAEQRIEAREPGATIVLFVDDLAIVDRMDVLSKENFTWLLKYGSSVNIWIFAGLDLQKVDDPSRWAALFATRIYGCIANSLRSTLSDFISNQQLSQIQARNCFLTKTGTQWIRFWAPKLQG